MATILIVDDDATLSQMLAEFLGKQGYRVVLAPDPMEGLQRAREARPDLVIMDYHMPGDTGAHLFEAFRRNKSLKDTPVLFMSGSKPEEDLLNEIASRARTAYLAKGVPLREMLAAIQGLLKTEEG